MSEPNMNFTHEFQLPSRGFLNPEIPEGKIVQRCMMLEDQKFLSSSAINPEDKSKTLLKRTITSPENLDIDQLTPADTMYLLFKLRVLSYGDMYKFKTRCPECGKKIEVEVNLSKLAVDYLPNDYQDKMKVVLPHAGDTVYTRLTNNADSEEVAKEAKRRRKKFNTEENYETILRLVKSIDRIELKTPNSNGDKVLDNPVDLEDYVSKLTDLDATAIIACSDAKFGIDAVQEVVCPNCRELIDTDIYFGAGFFRPQYDLSHR